MATALVTGASAGLGEEFAAEARPLDGVPPDMALGAGNTGPERALIEAHPDLFSSFALLPQPEERLRELAATLTAVFTPAFMVSASTVMCDVLMLAFWVWAVVFWLRGTDEEGGRGSMLAAALLITLSALTKYFGISLLALLAAYSLASRHELKRWLPWLLIPVIALASYQLLTASMYGRGLLLDATAYASGVRKLIGFSAIGNLYTGLVFVGGTLFSVMLVSNGLWKRRTMGIPLGYRLAGPLL